MKETFNSVESENISLDSSKISLISNIMSNIKIPMSNTPEWARSLPEDVWKKNLIENLNAKQTNLFTSKDKE